jgi:hypothetical protein
MTQHNEAHSAGKKFPKSWFCGAVILVIATAGLGVCKLVEGMFFGSGDEIMEHSACWAAIMVISFLIALTFVVLVPLPWLMEQLKARRDRPRRKLRPIDVVLVVISLPIWPIIGPADVEVPRWISYPLLTVLWLIILLIAHAVVLMLLVNFVFGTP